MISSMTGFGRVEESNELCHISAEIKSVNHRYLDLNIKMPKRFNAFEAQIRNEVRKYIQRGKVDLFIAYEPYDMNELLLNYNKNMAAQYLEYARRIEEEFGVENDIKASILLNFPEVVSMREAEADLDRLKPLLFSVINRGCAEFAEARKIEGERLKEDMLVKLKNIKKNISIIQEKSPEAVDNYKKTLKSKIEELINSKIYDESRILTETAIYADKVCIDEEIVRLKSHVEAVSKELAFGGAVGRKLDFIAQEMNREANTILSKTPDVAISETAVELKTDIEKLREQIQNIE